jgi:hypothetical protein
MMKDRVAGKRGLGDFFQAVNSKSWAERWGPLSLLQKTSKTMPTRVVCRVTRLALGDGLNEAILRLVSWAISGRVCLTITTFLVFG